MSYDKEMQIIKNIEDKYKVFREKNNDNLEFISLLCCDYYFVNNLDIKKAIIETIKEIVNNNKLNNAIEYIMSKNIILEEEKIISKWLIINRFLKREEFLLVKSNKSYKLEFIKDFNPIKIDELLK